MEGHTLPLRSISFVWARAVVALIACLLPVAAGSAAAQAPGAVLGTTAVVSMQGTGKSDGPNLFPGIGGTAPGAIIFMDVIPARHVSVGGELSWSSGISGHQTTRYADFDTKHRDAIYSGIFKVRSSAAAPVQIAGVGGLGFAQRVNHREGHERHEIPPYVGSPFEQTVSDWVPAVTWGVDVATRGQHVGFLFVTRFHYLYADELYGYQVGVTNLLFRIGAGVSIRF